MIIDQGEPRVGTVWWTHYGEPLGGDRVSRTQFGGEALLGGTTPWPALGWTGPPLSSQGQLVCTRFGNLASVTPIVASQTRLRHKHLLMLKIGEKKKKRK